MSDGLVLPTEDKTKQWQLRSQRFQTNVSELRDLLDKNMKMSGSVIEMLDHLREHILFTNLPASLLMKTLECSTALLVELSSSDPLILFVSPVVERMFGYSQGQLEGAFLSTLIPTEFREIHKQHVAKYRTAPKDRQMGYDPDACEDETKKLPVLQGIRQDGSKFLIEVWLSSFGEAQKNYGVANIHPCREVIVTEDSQIIKH